MPTDNNNPLNLLPPSLRNSMEKEEKNAKEKEQEIEKIKKEFRQSSTPPSDE